MKNWNSKKFISLVLFVVIGFIFVLLDKVSGEFFLSAYCAVFGIYSHFNVKQKILPTQIAKKVLAEDSL